MTDIISILLFSLSAVFYCISQLQQQGKLRWVGNQPLVFNPIDSEKREMTFWGKMSHRRKYKYPIEIAPSTWYYKFFVLPHKERFPGSATIFVSFTDGYHLCQAIFLACISLSLGIQHERWIWATLIARACFGVVFTLTYKWAAR